MVLIGISLLNSDVEHFFYLAICMSYLVKYLFKSFDHLQIDLSWFFSFSYWDIRVSYYAIMSYIFHKYFLPFVVCLFTLFIVFFSRKKLSVCCGSLFLFLILLAGLLVSHHKEHCQEQGQRAFTLYSCGNFIVTGLTFKSLIHFKIIFASAGR